jgi:hypothetical protein
VLSPSLSAQNGALQAVLADVEDPSKPVAVAPGEWQIEWQGGAEIATGKARLNVTEADPFQWTQKLDGIDTTKELVLEWTTKGIQPSDGLSLTALFLVPESETTLAVGTVACRAAGNSTGLTLPESLMKQMPPSKVGGLVMLIAEGRTAAAKFAAPFRLAQGETDFAAFDQRFAVIRMRQY